MLKYILKRVLFFIPTLVAISLLTFFISIHAPGDPVEIMLNRSAGGEGQNTKKSSGDNEYAELRHQLGFDLPLFYFSLTDIASPDTFHKIIDPIHRRTIERISHEFGKWENVSGYYLSLKELEKDLLSDKQEAEDGERTNEAVALINELYGTAKIEEIKKLKLKLSLLIDSANLQSAVSKKGLENIDISINKMIIEKNPYNKYIPALHWHRTNNQYHRWIVHFIQGDFGISFQDKRPVTTVFYSALEKTLGISLLSILLSYLIAIPLGVHSAIKKGKPIEKTITTTLFILYSLPNFWIATMMVIFFCGGDFLAWFPAPGSPAIAEDASLWYKIAESSYRLLLPLACWTYGSFAFISRQMRGGILSTIEQEYIQTARAKGLDEKKIIWKHALKNSLLPVVTLFASIFPLAISGAFVIETIFNIPGMGKLSLDALFARDYPIIFTVMMFTAMLTMLGNLVADVLYAMIDPRISYTQKP